MTVVPKKKRFSMPNSYVLICIIILLAAILTYIVPAGEYSYYTDEATGRSVVDADSYHYVDRNPTSFIELFTSIPRGMVQAASIIFLVFVIGGAFQVINDTGALTGSIDRLVKKFGDRSYLVIPIIMSVMSILGALGIVVVTAIAVIPLGMVLARKLNADPIAAVSIMYIGAYAGFTTSPFLPSTLQLAQSIAGLVPLSGMTLRVVVWIVVTVVSIIFTLMYVRKVQKNIHHSVLDKVEWEEQGDYSTNFEYTRTHALIILVVMLAFGVYAYGAVNWSWGNEHMSAMLLVAAVFSAIISRTNPNSVANSFITGCKNMVFGAMIVGVATAISVILTDGRIIHTIIHAISTPLSGLPGVLSAVCMFIVNLIFNFFVPSGSGQAAVVMPIMAPMSDVIGLTRQVSVLAYQWGDGFSNIIVPTSGVLMGCLGVAKVPFDKWLKYIMPLFLSWVAVGIVAISIAVIIGYA